MISSYNTLKQNSSSNILYNFTIRFELNYNFILIFFCEISSANIWSIKNESFHYKELFHAQIIHVKTLFSTYNIICINVSHFTYIKMTQICKFVVNFLANTLGYFCYYLHSTPKLSSFSE